MIAPVERLRSPGPSASKRVDLNRGAGCPPIFGLSFSEGSTALLTLDNAPRNGLVDAPIGC